MIQTYQIVERSGFQGIRCLVCKHTSWHPDDVANRYCGFCHEWHEFQALRMEIAMKEMTPLTSTVLVLGEVHGERLRQDELHGTQDHDPLKWMAFLGEEVGEANKAAHRADDNFNAFQVGELLDNYRAKLLQIAAVAVGAAESLDRQRTAERLAGEAKEDAEE